jgi:C4-dicarboxylate transporter DctM subunit
MGSLDYFGFISAINVIFLFIVVSMDQNPAILILAPVFAPIAMSSGIDPIHFGIIVLVNLIIELITPPTGKGAFYRWSNL